MKVETEKLAECKQRFKIEVPQTEVTRQFELTYKDLGRNARVDGFRPGKVPLSILKTRFQGTVASEALKKIVSAGYSEVLKEQKIAPLGDPEFEVGEKLPEEDKPFSFQVTLETWPEVKVDKYKELSLEREKIEINEQEVEAILQMKREENADLVAVEGRPVVKGDWVVIDFRNFFNDKPFQNAEGYLYQLDSGTFPPEVDEKLIGRMPDANEEFEVEANLKGKDSSVKLLYKIKLIGIKDRRLLIVNDDFAKDLGDFNNLAELREDIKIKLQARAREEEEEKLRSQIMSVLVEKNTLEVPSLMVEDQLKHLMLISGAGVNNSTGDDEEKNKMKEKLRPVAVDQVKASLLLEEIAHKENVQVTDEEINKEAEKIKIPLNKERKDELAYRIKRRKTLDFIMNAAKIKDKEKSLVLTSDQVRTLMPPEKKFQRQGGDGGKIVIP